MTKDIWISIDPSLAVAACTALIKRTEKGLQSEACIRRDVEALQRAIPGLIVIEVGK